MSFLKIFKSHIVFKTKNKHLKQMHNNKIENNYESGNLFIDSLSISEDRQNFLFAALFLTAVFVLIGGNLLLQNTSVFFSSFKIAVPCFSILLIFYALSRLTGSSAWGIALTYSLVWMLVYSRQFWLVPLVYILAMFALVYVFKYMRVERAKWLSVIVMAIIGTATIFSIPNPYTSFNMVERLYAGNVHQDTLFHASIAAMIKNYGVSSTGLHGLVEIPYHILSHVLFAGLSLLSGAGVIEVYGVATWILLLPVLFFAITTCSAILEKAGHLNLQAAWGCTCALLVLFPFLFHWWGVGYSFFVSESYLVSLGLFLLVFPILIKKNLNITDLLLITMITALMAYAKASIVLFFAGLWFLRIVFLLKSRTKFDFAAIILIFFTLTWVVFDSAQAVGQKNEFGFFNYLTIHSLLSDHIVAAGKILFNRAPWEWSHIFLSAVAIVSFMLCHFLLSWIVIFHGSMNKVNVPILRIPAVLYSLGAVLAGIFICAILKMPGIYYFTNISFFVSLPFAVHLISQIWCNQKKWFQFTFCSGVLVVLLYGFYQFKMSFTASSGKPQVQNVLIDFLCNSRETSNINTVHKADAAMLPENPVNSYAARPFLFPAVSERPWIDVIDTTKKFEYINYGYAMYGLVGENRVVNIQPELLPGMQIICWVFEDGIIHSVDKQ